MILKDFGTVLCVCERERELYFMRQRVKSQDKQVLETETKKKGTLNKVH